MSSFRWGMVAWSTLTHDQMACRNVLASLVFSSLQYYCFPSCFCLSWAWLHQLPSTFWDGTQSFVGREHATIHEMKALMILFLKTLIALRFKDKTGLFKANGPFKCLSPCNMNVPQLSSIIPIVSLVGACEPARETQISILQSPGRGRLGSARHVVNRINWFLCFTLQKVRHFADINNFA